MCPPSSGSSGHEVEHAEEQVEPGQQREQPRRSPATGDLGRSTSISPATRPAPTTLIGPFGSRSSRPTRPGRRRRACTGIEPSALTVCQVSSPIVRHDEARALALEHEAGRDAEEADLVTVARRSSGSRRSGHRGVGAQGQPRAVAAHDRSWRRRRRWRGSAGLLVPATATAWPLNDTIRSPGPDARRRRPGPPGRWRCSARPARRRPGMTQSMTHCETSERGARRDAVAHEHDAEQQERDHQVDRGPAGHHDELLPPRQTVEQPVLVAGLDELVLRGAGVGDQLR